MATLDPNLGKPAASKQSNSNQVEVKLLGQRILLRSAGEPERVREVLELVKSRINDAERRVKTATAAAPHYVALQALLDLAEEYCQAKTRAKTRFDAMAAKSDNLLSLIEAELK